MKTTAARSLEEFEGIALGMEPWGAMAQQILLSTEQRRQEITQIT